MLRCYCAVAGIPARDCELMNTAAEEVVQGALRLLLAYAAS